MTCLTNASDKREEEHKLADTVRIPLPLLEVLHALEAASATASAPTCEYPSKAENDAHIQASSSIQGVQHELLTICNGLECDVRNITEGVHSLQSLYKEVVQRRRTKLPESSRAPFRDGVRLQLSLRTMEEIIRSYRHVEETLSGSVHVASVGFAILEAAPHVFVQHARTDADSTRVVSHVVRTMHELEIGWRFLTELLPHHAASVEYLRRLVAGLRTLLHGAVALLQGTLERITNDVLQMEAYTEVATILQRACASSVVPQIEDGVDAEDWAKWKACVHGTWLHRLSNSNQLLLKCLVTCVFAVPSSPPDVEKEAAIRERCTVLRWLTSTVQDVYVQSRMSLHQPLLETLIRTHTRARTHDLPRRCLLYVQHVAHEEVTLADTLAFPNVHNICEALVDALVTNTVIPLYTTILSQSDDIELLCLYATSLLEEDTTHWGGVCEGSSSLSAYRPTLLESTRKRIVLCVSVYHGHTYLPLLQRHADWGAYVSNLLLTEWNTERCVVLAEQLDSVPFPPLDACIPLVNTLHRVLNRAAFVALAGEMITACVDAVNTATQWQSSGIPSPSRLACTQSSSSLLAKKDRNTETVPNALESILRLPPYATDADIDDGIASWVGSSALRDPLERALLTLRFYITLYECWCIWWGGADNENDNNNQKKQNEAPTQPPPMSPGHPAYEAVHPLLVRTIQELCERIATGVSAYLRAMLSHAAHVLRHEQGSCDVPTIERCLLRTADCLVRRLLGAFLSGSPAKVDCLHRRIWLPCVTEMVCPHSASLTPEGSAGGDGMTYPEYYERLGVDAARGTHPSDFHKALLNVLQIVETSMSSPWDRSPTRLGLEQG